MKQSKKPAAESTVTADENDLTSTGALMEAVKATMELLTIPLSSIKLSDKNPRQIDPNSPDIKALAENIKAVGLLNPLIVGLADEDGKRELIAGYRRYAACKLAGMETVAVNVAHANEAQAQIIALTENMQRENLSPMQEAGALKQLVESGVNHKTASAILGWPLSKVARRAKLLSLSPDWLKFIESNEFPNWTVGHYELIALYSPESQAGLLESIRSQPWHIRNCSVSDLSATLAHSSRLIKSAPWDPDDALLVPDAGSCKACPQRTGATPNLFEAEKSKDKLSYGDRCLNESCWKSKVEAFSKIRFAKIKEKHPDILLVKENWSSDDPNVLTRNDYNDCKKDTKGAKLAYITDGSSEGQTKYIVLESRKAKNSKAARIGKDGKPIGPSIEERQKNLNGDRAKWMIDEVLKRLQRGKYEFGGHASALVIAFGTDQKRNYFKDDAWKTYFKYDDPKLPQSESVDAIVKQVLPVIIKRFGFGLNREQANERRKELANVCGIFGIDMNELTEAAAKAVPVPKALALQLEAEKLKSKKPAAKDFTPPPVKVKGNVEKKAKPKKVKRASALNKTK